MFIYSICGYFWGSDSAEILKIRSNKPFRAIFSPVYLLMAIFRDFLVFLRFSVDFLLKKRFFERVGGATFLAF
jgi:hypothetical protein